MRRALTSAMRKYHAWAALLIWVVALAGACLADNARRYGTVTGLIKYGGPAPSPVPLTVTKDREVCGTAPVYDQSLLVGHDHGIAGAVVTLADAASHSSLKSKAPVRFDQKGCQYVPHVAVFPAGSTVVILNSDGILHNIHTDSTDNPVIDLAQPGFKKEVRVTIAKPEIIKVTCDAHNWMEGWWYVTNTPYYAITDKGGRYVIRGVPPGTYTVQVWQERLGTQSRQLIVRPGLGTASDFTFKPVANHRS